MGSFHAGELALQAETGAARRLAEVGPRFLRDHMPDPHREFFAQLPFVLAGTLDGEGQPWASVLAGPPGFAHSPDPRCLRVDAPLPAARAGMPIGLLGLEAHTRRRNRLNGVVTAVDARGFEVEVGQSFGNCPKYIVPRVASFEGGAAAAPAAKAARLAGEALRIVREADTFFIASAHPRAQAPHDPSEGVDVSHRGGTPGFVGVEEEGSLLQVADFAGNSYFNTLGNLLLQPRCGLLFIDYAKGAQVQVAARAEVVRGPQRHLRFEVREVIFTPQALPLRWQPAALAQL